MHTDQLPHTATPARENIVHDAARELIDISRFWLGVDAKPKAHHTEHLHPLEIIGALATGHIVHWKDWTLRTTPPRRRIDMEGQETWGQALWVASPHGFSTFPAADHKSIDAACAYIRQRQARAQALAMALESDQDSDEEAYF